MRVWAVALTHAKEVKKGVGGSTDCFLGWWGTLRNVCNPLNLNFLNEYLCDESMFLIFGNITCLHNKWYYLEKHLPLL